MFESRSCCRTKYTHSHSHARRIRWNRMRICGTLRFDSQTLLSIWYSLIVIFAVRFMENAHMVQWLWLRTVPQVLYRYEKLIDFSECCQWSHYTCLTFPTFIRLAFGERKRIFSSANCICCSKRGMPNPPPVSSPPEKHFWPDFNKAPKYYSHSVTQANKSVLIYLTAFHCGKCVAGEFITILSSCIIRFSPINLRKPNIIQSQNSSQIEMRVRTQLNFCLGRM